MEIQNLFEAHIKEDIVRRINLLKPGTQRKWGKMEVAQMLAHCQRPLSVAFGDHNCKSNIIVRWFAPFFKEQLYNDKPFRQNLPTDKSFKISDSRDFINEKNRLIEMINRFSEENISHKPHPVFGKLTIEQWSRSNWKHLDHHLRQFGV